MQTCAGCPGQLRSLGRAFSGGLLSGAALPATSWRSGDVGEGCAQGRGLVVENAKQLHSRTWKAPLCSGPAGNVTGMNGGAPGSSGAEVPANAGQSRQLLRRPGGAPLLSLSPGGHPLRRHRLPAGSPGLQGPDHLPCTASLVFLWVWQPETCGLEDFYLWCTGVPPYPVTQSLYSWWVKGQPGAGPGSLHTPPSPWEAVLLLLNQK